MKIKYITLLILLTSLSYGQDTIYTFHYPNGIITNNLTIIRDKYYKFNPIDNAGLEITINKDLVKEIKYLNGTKYENPIQVVNREIIFPVNKLSGKIEASKVIEVENTKLKDLYNAIKTIPQGEIKYKLLASDEVDFSFQKYIGWFNVKFAGDPYVMTFNLLIKFKEGKIKYEYSDFVASFQETKSKGNLSGDAIFSNGVYTRTNEHVKILDKMYSGIGMGDEKHFWLPTLTHLNESISSLEKLCKDAQLLKTDKW